MYSSNEKKRLRDFEFYINERFTYEYNFFVNWELEMRIEKELEVTGLKNNYPIWPSDTVLNVNKSKVLFKN